jgi:hypothetical protein
MARILSEQPMQALGLLGSFCANLDEIDARRQTILQHNLTGAERDIEGPDTWCERHMPRTVGVGVRPANPIITGFGEDQVTRLKPGPNFVGRRGKVIGSKCHIGKPCFFEHVSANAVGAEHDAIRSTLRMGVANTVIHVAPRVVRNRPRQVAVEMHAMNQQPVVSGQRFEPPAGISIVNALSHMDMNANAMLGSQSCCRGQRVVGAGERCVHTDHAPTTFAEKAIIFCKPSPSAIDTMTICDAVCEVRAYTDLCARFGNDAERTFDYRRAFVMIDDGGRSRHQSLGRAKQRRPSDHVVVKRHIQPPPNLLKNFQEAGGLLRWSRHTAGESGIQVMVAAHQA